MVKDLICSDCGCEDVKLITETADIYRKNSPLYYAWVIIPVILMLVGIGFLFSLLSFVNEDSYLLTIEEEYLVASNKLHDILFRVVIGSIFLSAGIILSVFTLLVDSFCGYSTETRIIAVCPHCGKTWFVAINKNRKIKYKKTDTEKEIAILEKQLAQLKSNDDGKTEN